MKNEIGKRLKEFRESLGLSQKEIVNGLGVSYATWSNYENGTSSPSLKVLRTLRQLYGVDLNEIIDGSESPIRKAQTVPEFIRAFMSLPVCGLEQIEAPDFWEYLNQDPNLSADVAIAQAEGTFQMPHIPAAYFPRSVEDFLSDWQKIKSAYDTGAIDDELLSLWTEKEIQKFKGRPIYDDPEKKTT